MLRCEIVLICAFPIIICMLLKKKKAFRCHLPVEGGLPHKYLISVLMQEMHVVLFLPVLISKSPNSNDFKRLNYCSYFTLDFFAFAKVIFLLINLLALLINLLGCNNDVYLLSCL